MSVQKLTIEQVPKDVLGDLEALITDSKKEYVAIGSSYYAMTPMPAIQLMEILGRFMEALEGVRRKVIENILSELTPDQQKEFNSANVFVTMRDMLKDTDSLELIKELMSKVLTGVEPKDLDSITTNQLAKVIDVVVKININTLPQSFREALLPGSTMTDEEGIKSPEEKEEATDPTKNP